MHDDLDAESYKDSVNYLINKLCLSLLQQHHIPLGDKEAAVRKLKFLSFQILLRKSPRPPLHEDTDFEPQRELDVQIFAAKLSRRFKPSNESNSDFDNLEIIKNESSYFNEGVGKGVLQLLLALQGNVHEEECEVPIMCPPKLLVPGPFTLHADYKNNPHYPFNNDYNIMNPAPKFFKGVHELKSADNPYLPRFLFEGEKDQLLALDNKFDNKPQFQNDNESDCTFTGMTKRLVGSSMRINTNSFRLFPESYGHQKTTAKLVTNRCKEVAIPKRHEIDDTQKKKLFRWNWEGLACFGISCSKPFAGDANVSLLLQSYINQEDKCTFEANILEEEDFIKDLKSLTVGIQSDTFQHDEFIVFFMKPNITIAGVLPETIKYIVNDFLACGTCYKRIQTMIMKKDYKLMFEGFIFKALCSALDEYLLTFRQYVFGKRDEHLLGFYKRMKKMIKQITDLSYTLAVHPNVDVSVKPPMGSQFLGYLYREIMRLTENDYINVLIFILKRCCHVYFKHLQKWIYYGLLDDPSNELFVGFVDHYRENTKYFYDKAYFVRKESVPGFFQNFEDQIMQCGKYTMLLKAFNPNHPLFGLDYPSISVCLSSEEISKLESSCAKYIENAQDVCSEPITIRQVFETRSEEKRQFFKRMIERSRANLERWTDEQNELAMCAAEKKRKLLEGLSAQLEDAKQRKIKERKASVEIELKYLREAEKLEEQQVIKDNINLRKRIEYYQELCDSINEKEKTKDKEKDHQTKLTLTIPPLTTLQPPSRTPASTAGTDFESCFGDDDEVASEYEECISDEFIDKFSENEKDLKSIVEVNEKDESRFYSHTGIKTVSEHRALNEDIDLKEDNVNSMNTFIKRSISDVINSNELPTPAVTQILQKNRQKAMSGTNLYNCVKPLEVNVKNCETLSETGCAEGINTIENAENKSIATHRFTEAQQNKLRVLNEEFGFRNQNTETKSMPDINLNTLPDNELTDLQRNRRRMMQNDLFSEYNKDPIEARSNLYLNLDSDRARNRQKVLESEYNILTGKNELASKTSITPNTEDTPMTPMSTASDDIPLTETLSEFQVDKDNGNISKDIDSKENVETSKKLTLNVTLANEMPRAIPLATAATFSEMTPECALNTAGIMAKKGIFSFANAEKCMKYQKDASTGAPVDNKSLREEEACPEPDYDNTYKRCQELLATNFKSNTSSPFIRLNSPVKNTAKLNKCSIQTEFLTEYLQKSVVIPMSTHLELINNEVMRTFLHDLKIIDHFRSLRNYFFMMDGEFGLIICNGIIGKLENGAKPDKLLNYQILHSILDTALGSSITGKDKNAENLSFIVNDVPEKFELSSPEVLNNLSLSYRVTWPLNLILNPESLDQYANIFKYLVRVRRISWILERAYQILKESVNRHGKDILKSPQYRHVQLIRHKFYHFVHVLQNHITANALQASWKTFKDELVTAKTIEDIYRKHTTYIKRILFLCMLNKRSAEFYNTIDNVFKISIRFYNNLKSREFKIKSNDEHFTHSRYEKLINDELEFDKFIKYTIYLGNKIVRHGYQAEIGEFIRLINYNQYYMKNMY